MIPDGYDLVGDEYVRVISSASHTEIEIQIEANAPLFFSRIGYNIRKVPRADVRTADYEYEAVGIEVTSVREYLKLRKWICCFLDMSRRTIEFALTSILKMVNIK